MHGVESYERIRRAYFVEYWGVRKIAREFHVHRRVVRAAIASAQPKPYQRDGPPTVPGLGTHEAWIDEILRQDRKAPRKQRHTARRIYKRLVAERGYAGGESTVRRLIAARKQALGIEQPEVYIPLDHPPGRDGQADWGVALVKIGGMPWNAQVLTVTACSSGAPFVQAFPVQTQEAFLEGLRRAFEFYGGVFHRIAFDNLRAAVKKVLEGRGRVEQEAFVAFRSHYLFDSFFCLPGERGAHEKGAVEGRVGYARRNFFVPIPEQPSWSALNDYLRGQCDKELLRQPDGKSQTIGALWERERPLLLPLPAYPFDCARKLFVRADSHSRIRVDGIRYSVPTPYAYRELLAKVYVDEIVVVHRDAIIARHPRCFTSGEQELDPLHYLPGLEKKPHALDYGLPFVRWRLPRVFDTLRQKLEENGPKGLRDYIRVLQTIPQCGLHTVAEAVLEALDLGRPSANGVLCRLESRGLRLAPVSGARPELRVDAPNVSQYDQLVKKEIPDGNDPVAEGLPQAAAAAGHGP